MPEPITPTPPAGTPQGAEGTIVTPPAEVKPGETKPDEKPAGSEPQKKVVPEAYDLKLPKDSLLDQAKLADVASYAKAKGLTNEEAQEVLERENASIAAYVDTQKKQQEEAWEKQKEEWVTEWKNDKEIGGEEFKKNAELAKRIVDRFGDAAFKEELNRTGFGNHPGLGRLLVKLGKAMSEDQLVIPGASPVGVEKKSLAEVLYPNHTPKKE